MNTATGTKITAHDGRILTVTGEFYGCIYLTDGRSEFFALPSLERHGVYAFVPVAHGSRKPGGRFSLADLDA